MADRRQESGVKDQGSGVRGQGSGVRGLHAPLHRSSFIVHRYSPFAAYRLPPTAYRLRWAAFTLVELLVVIAIIGILIALLLPAIQSAREAARRTQCCDNLKNLALACTTYASAQKHLPPGKVVGSATTGGMGTYCKKATNEWSNWALEILPFMDDMPLYRQYHFDKPNGDASNDAVRESPEPIQSCPSDPNQPSVQTPQVKSFDSMTGSYKGVAGRGWYVQAKPAEAYWDSYQAGNGGETMRVLDRGPLPVVVIQDPTPGSVNGPPNCTMSILSRAPVQIKHVIDGTSKTLLIGEYTTSTQPSGGVSRSAFWANSTFGLNLGDLSLPMDCMSDPLHCSLATVNNNDPVNGGPGTQITLDPDYNRCLHGTYSSFPQPCERTFTGFHGGGVGINFAFVDGSVHRMTNTTDIRILSAMATIAGGEALQQVP